MKRLFFIAGVFQALIFVISCDSKRPESTGEFNYSVKISSVQILADVEIKEGDEIIQSGVTDESGNIEFSDVKALTDLTVKICGGTVKLISSTEPVAWTGCMESSFKPADVDEISITVDIFSTFISKYDSGTAVSEFQEYLDITTLPAPALQTSLTDATKRYLWYQGLAKVAENVSKANSVNPETMYSTENLLNLLYADLADDAVINGSTEAKFGSLSIDAAILKNIIADAIPSVDKAFSATDLKSWTDKIRNSEAKFLGGDGSGTDSEKPVVGIEIPANNSVVYGTVKVSANATDNKEITSLNCSITGEEMPELADSVEDPASFKAEFDSTLIPDGKITIKCIASDGTNLSEKEISVTVSNSNTVKMKAYITNELTLWDSVTIYDMAGTKVQTVSFAEDEETKTALAPGIYRFVFKGGTYKPVFLADETIGFDSSLETRGEVKAGEVTTVIATPLTTLREFLFKASGDEESSFELISEHIDSDFPLYIEPVSKNQLTENSKYYIVLAALERLAVLVGERHDPALEEGSITIEQVLKALTDDLKTDTQAVLDGGDTINQFPVDSYLFRYWYAIALKLFLESDENLTGLKFSDLQTVISNISMDESELFPEAEKPKKVTDRPPVISEKQFKRSFETEYQNYTVENIIYANDSVFELKFKALPDGSGDLTIDLVVLSGDVEVQTLSDINEEGIYEASVKFPVVADGEKSILIKAVDDAENTGTATLQAVKDTVKPVISSFELVRNTKPVTGEYAGLPFTFNYVIDELNYRNTQLAVKTAADSGDFVYTQINTVKSGSGQIAKTDLAGDKADGTYLFSVKFTDKAGNEEITEFQKVIDTINPTIDSIVMTPEINESGFINSRNITVEITAGDNIEQTLNYWIRRNITGYSMNGNNPPNVFNIEEPADAEISYWFKVSDQAGNESAESAPFVFTIDTINPVITISNKAALQAKSWKSSADELVLNYTIDELNREFCELRINGAKADDIIGYPASSITFKSNPLLDPEIGPALPNTVSIYCKDKAGNETEEVVNVYIDDTAPEIAIDASHFKYNDAVVDPRIGTWTQTYVPFTIADNFGRSKENLTVRYYYTAQVTNFLGVNISHRFPGEGTRAVEEWSDGAFSDARCYLSIDSCEIPVVHFLDSFLYNNSFEYMKDRITAFILNVEVSDTAGNTVSQSIDWVSDKESVSMESAGYGYDSGSMWLSFVSKKSVKSFMMTVNSVTSSPVCEQNFIDGMGIYVYSCPFTANTGSIYNVTISSIDYYSNLTVTGCSDFDSGETNYCFSGSVKASDPQLAVLITQQTATTLKYEVSSDSAITECRILKNGSNFATCNGGLATGSKTENISTWEDGNYTIKVSAKNTLNVIATKTVSFIIDTTPTSFSFDIVNYKSLYYKSAPTLSVNATIAGGVKKVMIYLPERYVHKTRNTDFVNCANQKCYGTYEKKIFEAEPNCMINPGGGSSCFFMNYTPPADLLSGFYERVRWVIISKRNGESETGYYDLKSINKIIRVANSDADYTKINKVTLDPDNTGMIIDFVPSVFSEAPLSSSASFSYKVFNNPETTKSTDLYWQICGSEEGSIRKQYQHYNDKIKSAFRELKYSNLKYQAYFDPDVSSYFFGENINFSYGYGADCFDDSGCPVDSEYLSVSTGCKKWIDGSRDKACYPDYRKHYTDETISVDGFNVCRTYSQDKCVEYFETCPDPFENETLYTLSYYGSFHFRTRCPLLRDFSYFPKDLKISVTDDAGRTATVQNSVPGSYTDPSECPQQKKAE